jgi:tRNA1Val (adenine37-N6)-methyltransferase
MFHFKQFSVDQSGCAMKINTDGVLLGALVNGNDPRRILDIGTGTGVIALMLAQRFKQAAIDAIEIDKTAAKTAELNFNNSPFKERLNIYPEDFKEFFDRFPDRKYNLVVSNPPFHLHSLKSQSTGKALARHADESFFEALISSVVFNLTPEGICCLILPLQTAALVKQLAEKKSLYLHKKISITSFTDAAPHREILTFGMHRQNIIEEKFVIYHQSNIYSQEYQKILKDFLTIF